MVGDFLGELIGTFCLLFLGLGITYLDSKPNQKKIALYWIIAVFIGNFIGSLIGSNSLNPIFLLKDFSTGMLSIQLFFIKLVGEIVGGALAAIAIFIIPLKKPVTLSDFAAVASVKKTSIAFIFEIVGTLSILFFSGFFGQFSSNILQFLLISIWIGYLVYRVGPMSGASFNPVRDLLPRTIYAIHYNRWEEWGNSLASANLGPVLGFIIWFFIFQVISLSF